MLGGDLFGEPFFRLFRNTWKRQQESNKSPMALCIKLVVLGFWQTHPMPKCVRKLKNTGLKSSQALLRFPVSSGLQAPVTSWPAGR